MIFILHRIVNIKKNANKISNVTIHAGMIDKPNTCSAELKTCSKKRASIRVTEKYAIPTFMQVLIHHCLDSHLNGMNEIPAMHETIHNSALFQSASY